MFTTETFENINSLLLQVSSKNQTIKPFWRCLIVSKTLVRTNLKFYPFGGNWGVNSIFGLTGPKSKKPHKFSALNLFMVIETILDFRNGILSVKLW